MQETQTSESFKKNQVDFDCPFPLKCSPFEKEMLDAVKEWAKRFKIIQTQKNEEDFDRDNIPLFATCSYPEAQGERLLAVVLFVYWFFHYDNHSEKEFDKLDLRTLFKVSRKYAEMILYPPRNTDGLTPLELSFLDFMDLCRKLTNDTWIHRFHRSWNNWNQAVHSQRQHKQPHLIPSLKEYMDEKCQTCANDLLFDLVELAYNVYLPDTVLYSSLMQNIRKCGARMLRYSNDVHSYNVDQMSGSNNNLVSVLIAEKGLSREKAIEKAIQMYNEQVQEFLRLEKDIPSFGPRIDRDVRTVIHGMKVCLRGNLFFHERTDRYGYLQKGNALINPKTSQNLNVDGRRGSLTRSISVN